MTQYVKTEVDIGNGLKFYVDGNSKITAGNGTYDNPKPNALSLPHISTCPGSTEQCREACLASFHKVLTADLRYVPLKEVKRGDFLMSFDEHVCKPNRRRRYKKGLVRAIRHEVKSVFKITLQSGKEFISTPDHLWLTRVPVSGNQYWKRTDELVPGKHFALKMFDEWEQDDTFDGGWLSGMYDGEGCLCMTNGVGNLVVSQKAGPVLDRLRECISKILGETSYAFKAQKRNVWQLRITGGKSKIIKTLGVLRPIRLLNKFVPEMMSEIFGNGDEVVSVEKCGEQEITMIDVDAKTMVVEGYAHHNCYVHGLRDNAPEIYKEYCKNEMVIHRILMSNKSMSVAAQLFGDWITENCADGFRWHVSGDVMSDRHATWISDVCKASPNIRHWIYTRSLELIQFLYAPNLALNLSADADNYDKAISIWEDVEGVRICYMTRDGSVPELPAGSVIFPDYSLRGREMDRPTDHWWWKQITTEQKRMVCPPDFFGQSERHRCGPCKKCLYPASYKDNQKAEEVGYEKRAI